VRPIPPLPRWDEVEQTVAGCEPCLSAECAGACALAGIYERFRSRAGMNFAAKTMHLHRKRACRPPRRYRPFAGHQASSCCRCWLPPGVFRRAAPCSVAPCGSAHSSQLACLAVSTRVCCGRGMAAVNRWTNGGCGGRGGGRRVGREPDRTMVSAMRALNGTHIAICPHRRSMRRQAR
jgi:hypothetical protein